MIPLFLGYRVVGFNTQPPEGGCARAAIDSIQFSSFNTQPPEGGCIRKGFYAVVDFSFNTQPPEGGCIVHLD